MKILKFFADWCQPCKALSMVIEGLELPYPIENVDIDQNIDAAKRYNVRTVPTVVLVNDSGDEVKRFSGIVNKDQFMKFLEV